MCEGNDDAGNSALGKSRPTAADACVVHVAVGGGATALMQDEKAGKGGRVEKEAKSEKGRRVPLLNKVVSSGTGDAQAPESKPPDPTHI